MLKRIIRAVHLRKNKYLYKYKHKAIDRYFQSQQKRSLVFILGTQKTGSTAIAALLSHATEKHATLDLLDVIHQPEWQLKVKFNLMSFRQFAYLDRHEFSNYIIKEPSLTFFFDDLIKLYPNAKFIMIIRDPYETIRSVLNRVDIPGNLEHINFDDWRELNVVPAWKLVLSSAWLGLPDTSYIEALAHRWNVAADIYLKNKKNFTLIKYEDFVENKQMSINKLAESVSLEVKQDIKSLMNHQYQGKGRPVDSLEFFGQANYRKIRNICKKNATIFGYEFKEI